MTPSPVRNGIIPTTAWIIAAVVAAGVAFCMLVLARHLPPPLFLAIIAGSVFMGGYVLLIGYVYGDAKRRGMRYVLWTWLAILVPNALGIVLYFILREPLMVYCSHCGHASKSGFAFCPNCGSGMAPTCPNCKRVVQPGWPHCPYCGTSLSPARTNPNAPTTGGIPGTA